MSTGNRNVKFLVLAVGIVIAAGAISYFGGFYPPATDQGTGAIGAANRYRAEQMTDRDVVLGDPQVAAFMQTDTFDRIMKSESARKLLASPEFQAAMQSQGLSELLARPGVQKVFQEAGLMSILQEQGRASRQDKLKSRVDAEMFSRTLKVAEGQAGSRVVEEASASSRKDRILQASSQRIQEAAAGGRLDLLANDDFVKALVYIQGDVAGAAAAKFDEAQGKRGRIWYEDPSMDYAGSNVMQATADAQGRRVNTSILEETLARNGKMNDTFGKALEQNPELHLAVMAGLEAGAFTPAMQEASLGARKQRIQEASARVFEENLGQQKFQRILTDGAALQRLQQADLNAAAMATELAALAQNEAQWNSIFGEAQGKGILMNQELLAGARSIANEMNANQRLYKDLSALARMNEAGSGVLLEALASGPQAAEYLASGRVQKALADATE